MNNLNERFKEIRLFLHMSQEEFGKSLGLSKSGISNIEKGERGLRDTYIKAVCIQYSINESWLRTGNGEMLLANEVTAYESFESYLKSLGYNVKLQQISEDEYLIRLAKSGISVEYSEDEFGKFQDEVKKSVEYQIWQKQKQ